MKVVYISRINSGNELSHGVGNCNGVICSRETWQDVTYEKGKKKGNVMPVHID